MTCDNTAFGKERENPDWTADELEVLEKELEAARARLNLETAKEWTAKYRSTYTPAQVESAVRGATSRTDFRVEYDQRLETARTEVYEKAHDRHFLRMIRLRLDSVPAEHHFHQGA